MEGRGVRRRVTDPRDDEARFWRDMVKHMVMHEVRMNWNLTSDRTLG